MNGKSDLFAAAARSTAQEEKENLTPFKSISEDLKPSILCSFLIYDHFRKLLRLICFVPSFLRPLQDDRR